MSKSKDPIGLGRVKTAADIQAPTLTGDVRDLILQEMRDAKNALPWTLRPEREQRDMIDRANRFADTLVRGVITAVAAEKHPSVRVQIDSWTVKDGLKIVSKASALPENIEALCNGTASPLLVFLSVDEVTGERAPIVPLPDQPKLGDGDDDGPVFDNTDACA